MSSETIRCASKMRAISRFHLRPHVRILRRRRAGEQRDEVLLRLGGGGAGLRGRRGEQRLHAVAAGVEQLALILHLAEAADDAEKVASAWAAGMRSLANEDLPQRDQRLERAGHVRAEQRIADLGDRFGGVEELADRLIGERCPIRRRSAYWPP